MSRVSRIFITGATGCIGQYVVEALLRETAHELILSVRDPARVPASFHAERRVRLVVGDLRETHRWDDAARKADSAVLIHTSWTDSDEAHSVNVEATTALLQRFQPGHCRRVIYFSTASILDADSQLLAQAEKLGTAYIRSKYFMRRLLDERRDFLPLAPVPPLVILYPTLVLGGDATHPLSHVSRTLEEIVRHRRWLRWFAGDASFHFIHAADIAQIVAALVDGSAAPDLARDYILGEQRITLDDSIDAVLAHSNSARAARIPLTPAVTHALIKLLRIRLTPWDRYCLERRHFTYENATGAAAFGRTPYFATLRAALSAGSRIEPTSPH
ncbi:MAG: NAD-dependent epimerase/dehydratase family protein [Gemmatimonadaceae bacterium]